MHEGAEPLPGDLVSAVEEEVLYLFEPTACEGVEEDTLSFICGLTA